jgi:hypothetical protein
MRPVSGDKTIERRARSHPEEHRVALLGTTPLCLMGRLPQPGELFPTRAFSIPPARNARAPLTPAALRQGLVLVSTLPNIGRHACAAQILDFEEQAMQRLDAFRLIHVSGDESRFWSEVDHFHPVLAAEGFSLFDADADSVTAFGISFGVAVEGHGRIAHGLFALLDGMFVASEVPYQQLSVPDVGRFLDRMERLLDRRPPRPLPLDPELTS